MIPQPVFATFSQRFDVLKGNWFPDCLLSTRGTSPSVGSMGSTGSDASRGRGSRSKISSRINRNDKRPPDRKILWVLWLLDDSREKSAQVLQLYRCIQNNLSSYFVKIQATNIRIPILEYPNFRDKQKKTTHLTYEISSGLLLQWCSWSLRSTWSGLP